MQAAPIVSLCTRVSSGGTPSRKHPEFYADASDGHLWSKSKELLDGSIEDSEEKISDEGLQQSSAKYFPANTVLMAMYGANVGQLGWLKRPATVNQAVCGMVVNEGKADPRYLFYALLHTRPSLAAKAQGAAQQNLNQGLIKEFEIPFPHLEVQRRIATILSTYDDLIENNLRRIKILEEMAQNLYREWFVKFRFPGHEQVRMVDSPLGKIPEGWEVVCIKNVADVNAESVRKGCAPKHIVYVDIASVSPGNIDNLQEIPFTDAPSRARRVARHGDIIWSSVRPNRRSFSLIVDPPKNLIVSTGFAVISSRQVPFSYLYETTTTDDFVDYLINHAKGATYPAVNAHDFENARILAPSNGLLQKFDQFVSLTIALRHRLRAKNTVLRQTRDLLLPKLISGELDVSSLPIAVPEETA